MIIEAGNTTYFLEIRAQCSTASVVLLLIHTCFVLWQVLSFKGGTKLQRG